MRLFAQTAAVIFLLMLFSFGTAVITRYALVLPKLRELEALADRKDLRRVLLAIDGKKLQLSAIAYNHAVSDDMYDYVRDRRPNFFDNRFPLAKFLNLDIGMVVLLDREGNLLEQRDVDLVRSVFTDRSPLSLSELRPYLIDSSQVHPNAPIFDSGVLASRQGPLIYGVASVMRGDTDSEARGSLLVATPFDEEFLRDVALATQLRLAIVPLPGHEGVSALDQLYRNKHDQLFWTVTDNHNQPALRLRLTLPHRDFDTQLMWAPLLMALMASALGYFVVMSLVQRLLLRPIQTIGRHLQRVHQQGDYNLRLNSGLGNELGDLSRDIDALVKHAQTQQNQLQQQALNMQLLSYQDGLTGLANRRRFDQALTDNWALAQRTQTPLALLMCDVDYFKSFNDHYGHQYGDEVLVHVADIIRRTVVRHSDLAARYGGEEFAVLLPDTGEAGAQRIAERIREALNGAAIAHAPSPIGSWLTLSIGAASLMPNTLQTPRELVRRADEALYASKAAGRDRITLASTLP